LHEELKTTKLTSADAKCAFLAISYFANN